MIRTSAEEAATETRIDAQRSDSSWLKTAIIQLIVLSVAFFVFGSFRNAPYKIESDGKYYYQYLVSIFLDGDLDFSNNYRAEAYNWMGTEIDHYRLQDTVDPITNRPINYFSIGPAILWAPQFLLLHGFGSVANLLSGSWPDLNPWSRYFQYGVMFAAVLYCVAGLHLTGWVLRRWFGQGVVNSTSTLLLFATGLFYYSVFEVSMSHVYDFFTMALLFVAYVRCLEAGPKGGLGNYALAGFAAGLHVLIRVQNLTTILFFGLFLAGACLRLGWKRGSLRFAAFSIIMGITLTPLLAVNAALRGSPWTLSHQASFFDPWSPHLLETLFSPRNGLFFVHPILLFGLVGALFAAIHGDRSLRSVLAPLLLSFAAQWYVNSIVADWWAGASFGNRRFISSYVLFAIGLAWLLQQLLARWPRFARGLKRRWVAYPAVLNLYLTMLYVFDYRWFYGEAKNVYALMFWDAPIRAYWIVQWNW